MAAIRYLPPLRRSHGEFLMFVPCTPNRTFIYYVRSSVLVLENSIPECRSLSRVQRYCPLESVSEDADVGSRLTRQCHGCAETHWVLVVQTHQDDC